MPEARGDDHVVAALDGLVEAVEQNTGDEQQLVRKVAELRDARNSGRPVTHALGDEPPPGTMELLGRVLSRLMEASGSARRALARAMRNEGTSIPTIARLFGVTHQRISNILNSSTPGAAGGGRATAGAGAGEAGQFDQPAVEPVEAERR